jgi:hypothetical protein
VITDRAKQDPSDSKSLLPRVGILGGIPAPCGDLLKPHLLKPNYSSCTDTCTRTVQEENVDFPGGVPVGYPGIPAGTPPPGDFPRDSHGGLPPPV